MTNFIVFGINCDWDTFIVTICVVCYLVFLTASCYWYKNSLKCSLTKAMRDLCCGTLLLGGIIGFSSWAADLMTDQANSELRKVHAIEEAKKITKKNPWRIAEKSIIAGYSNRDSSRPDQLSLVLESNGERWSCVVANRRYYNPSTFEKYSLFVRDDLLYFSMQNADIYSDNIMDYLAPTVRNNSKEIARK